MPYPTTATPKLAQAKPARRLHPKIVTVNGLRIRYAETVSSADRTILLTSPWPESIYAFAPIWTDLASDARLVAVDLPGFGRSERRGDLLCPRAMGGFLVELIDRLELCGPHLVGPDVGTAAGLFAAALRPGLLASLTVDGGSALGPLGLESPLRDWVPEADRDAFGRPDPQAIVDGAIDTIAGYEMPRAIRQDYLVSYSGDRFVEPMRYVHRHAGDLAALAPLLGGIETPVQIIAGCHDDAVPIANAQYLYERLSHRSLELVRAGHFVWEEAPGAYAGLVRDWTAGGYRAA